MPDGSVTARLLRREQWIISACLLLIALLAWAWLFRTAAGMGAEPAGSMPGMAMPAAEPGPPGAYLAGAFAMWFLMMTAMMLPSASPMILLYARVAQGLKAKGRVLVPTAIFAGVYLAVWAAFSLLAAIAQMLLVDAGVVSAATMQIGDERIAGVLLIAVGAYQLTPLKSLCIKSCRSPLSFLTQYWRPGGAGAVRLGLRHGFYCLGCCWMLMTLLFIGGVMSLIWVAILAFVVLVEKVAPLGRFLGTAAGMVAIVVGAGLMLGVRIP
jgi:predicted metal-binding membrane protein